MLIEVTRSVVARPSEVFAIVAGIENWPRIMSSVRSVEVLTSGPIDVGTRFRITRTMLGLEMTDEGSTSCNPLRSEIITGPGCGRTGPGSRRKAASVLLLFIIHGVT